MRHPIHGAPPLYLEIDHTADLGIVIEASGPEALFEKAGLALYATMIGPAGVEEREVRRVCAQGADWEDLLQQWLTELLGVFVTDVFVAADVTVQAITSTTVQGTIRGEKFDPARHTFYTEIKAVTYHELAVVRSTTGWRAQVIFDV